MTGHILDSIVVPEPLWHCIAPGHWVFLSRRSLHGVMEHLEAEARRYCTCGSKNPPHSPRASHAVWCESVLIDLPAGVPPERWHSYACAGDWWQWSVRFVQKHGVRGGLALHATSVGRAADGVEGGR